MTGQDFAVFILVALAAAYLFRQWFGPSKSGGCGKCGGCETPKKTETPLVQIDLGGSWKK
ncbi:Virus attachment protein p12 family protein [Abditibacterium utsteinense]|uniref:Virus attachment protein p12 family protein n=1 Tax=Abditibacterium utsteinense TaxID=1960156 RepID=A0A2S8SX83_9BACT|nr:FeoB-associated Cys-rich membrane protein [Abditibacterium utsteinense]PQV65411.1 Virus attachment protein p12 family protein [Abditibacterium utsteinense]